ncbi:MAG: hypothetical protein OQJ89_12155 [Kangiellaceae bacterium]|nr:hypothetical protein [Kangiellaceae bacterium]MCW8997161.1 hypothetical protein [Kangiellaceae bacterium]MCW9017713.1 hypothetical protein [Kangiellaceae bacterium]
MTSREFKTGIKSLLLRWKSLLAIGLVILAVVLDLVFIWGIFFWFWAIENTRTGEAYFVERIERENEPILYWLIIIILLLIGGYYFFFDEYVYSFLYHLLF